MSMEDKKVRKMIKETIEKVLGQVKNFVLKSFKKGSLGYENINTPNYQASVTSLPYPDNISLWLLCKRCQNSMALQKNIKGRYQRNIKMPGYSGR